MQNTSTRGLMFVMTGASGVGKGTIRELFMREYQQHPHHKTIYYSISWTSREQRTGEVDGVHYHFRNREQFEHERENGAGFLEFAEFVGNLYGTPRAAIEQALNAGQHVLLEIEVLGAMQVKAQMPEAVLIFVAPPSLSELRKRLHGRATESPDKIEKRLSRAQEEILHAHEFQYIILNDQLEQAVSDMHTVFRAEELRASRWTMSDLEQLVID